MKLEFGYGNIWVTSYGDKKGNYGVAFRIVPEKHIINKSDPSVVGKTFDDVPHDLYMEFSKSQSVQVVINKLAMVRDDLRAAEQSVRPTAFGDCECADRQESACHVVCDACGGRRR